MSTMQITVAKSYGVETLDNAIKAVAEKALLINSSTKEYAHALGELKTEFDKQGDTFKGVRFPDWLETVFSGKLSGQTCYKYAQVSNAFYDDSTLWDVFTLSKLRILLNCRKKPTEDAASAVWCFLDWYGDSINTMQNESWELWYYRNSQIMERIENAPDEETRELWKTRLTDEPRKGIEIPGVDADESVKLEYAEICQDKALAYLSSVTDSILSDIIKAYRKPDEYTLTLDGKAKKLDVVKTEDTNVRPEEEEEKPKTVDELKEDAHTALLAYVSALGDKAPKTLKTALTVLKNGGDK